MPIHPLQGARLPVVREQRDPQGRRYVMAQTPFGWCLRLPVEWTDRNPPSPPPTLDGRPVRLTISVLRRLAEAVRLIR